LASRSVSPLFFGRSESRKTETESAAPLTCVRSDPANLSGHSLRSGFITSAARHGASMDTLRGYVGDGQLFEDHAGEAFL
jgi:hypothetical protein